ncbi:hypothetical protein [Desulforamulus hydrothermalis]|uniref:hypothetical protein n=1 Tax=Desulforamulus hydrothermalis TaxID=412895 RepID=UPI0002F3EA3A|nr:hypothetical protein [Desulforamulus hydrothermalis]
MPGSLPLSHDRYRQQPVQERGNEEMIGLTASPQSIVPVAAACKAGKILAFKGQRA